MRNFVLVILFFQFSLLCFSQRSERHYPKLSDFGPIERMVPEHEKLSQEQKLPQSSYQMPLKTGKKKVPRTMVNGSEIYSVELTNSQNIFNVYSNPSRNLLSVDPRTKTVMLAKRGYNIGGSEFSNRLYYDISYNWGNTWQFDKGPVYNKVPVGPGAYYAPRYPMGFLHNPTQSADSSRLIGFFAASGLSGANNGWGGIVAGTSRIRQNAPFDTIKFSESPHVFMVNGISKNSLGEMFSVINQAGVSQNAVSYFGSIQVNKYVVNPQTNEWTETSQVIDLPDTGPALDVSFNGTTIRFAKTGGQGYITTIGRMNSDTHCPLDLYYLIVYQTQDFGLTWQGPYVADLTYGTPFFPVRSRIKGDSAYDDNNILQRVHYTFTDDFDAEVDNQGNLHFLGVISTAPQNQEPGEYYSGDLNLIHISTGPEFLASNAWNASWVYKTKTKRGYYGNFGSPGDWVEHSHYPQLAFTEDRSQFVYSILDTDSSLFDPWGPNVNGMNIYPDLFTGQGRKVGNDWQLSELQAVTGTGFELAHEMFYARLADYVLPKGDSMIYFVHSSTYFSPFVGCGLHLRNVFHRVKTKFTPKKNLVSGRVFDDRNGNCDNDEADKAVKFRIVRVMPGNFYAFTDGQGYFHTKVGSGSYKPGLLPFSFPSPFINNCLSPSLEGGTFSFATDSGGNYQSAHLPIRIPPCAIVQHKVGGLRHRPCSTSVIGVLVENVGGDTARNVTAAIKIPKNIYVKSINFPYSLLIGDSLYKVMVPKVHPNGFRQIVIYDSVACIPTLINKPFCVKSTLNFENGCPANLSSWNLVDLDVSGQCIGNVEFKIKNKGVNMTVERTFSIFKDSLLVFQSQFQLMHNDSLVFQVPNSNNASIYRLEAPQSPNHPKGMVAGVNVSCESSSVPVLADDVHENVVHYCVNYENSWDPNDKRVWPEGVGETHKVLPNTWLNYTIRFMNKGNGPAYKVVIADTLSDFLNPASFQLGMSSHPCRVDLINEDHYTLKFTFLPIVLPDSASNPTGSQGFVSFKIQPKAGLPAGTQVKNHAGIFFDWNPSIMTNETLNTIFIPTLTPGIVDSIQIVANKSVFVSDKENFSLFPNPGKNSVTLFSISGGSYSLTNSMGKMVKMGIIREGSSVLELSDLASGLYWVKLETEKGFSIQKWIKE